MTHAEETAEMLDQNCQHGLPLGDCQYCEAESHPDYDGQDPDGEAFRGNEWASYEASKRADAQKVK